MLSDIFLNDYFYYIDKIKGYGINYNIFLIIIFGDTPLRNVL